MMMKAMMMMMLLMMLIVILVFEGRSSQYICNYAERKPEKNSGLYRIRTVDLCDTGAALYQLS